MSGIASALKRQRDRTWLTQLSDPTAVAVTADTGDGTGTGYTDPYSYVQQVSTSTDPYPQYTNTPVQRFEFLNLAEWDVVHNLGNDPMLTIWEYPQIQGFDTAPFGTSPFGGSLGAVQVNMQSPTITKIDDNSFKVAWTSAASGKVVVYG